MNEDEMRTMRKHISLENTLTGKEMGMTFCTKK